MWLNLHWRRRLPILLGAAAMAVSGCVSPQQQQQAEKPADTRLERSLLDAAANSELQRDHNSALTYYRTLYRRDPTDAGVVVGLSRNLRRLNRANEANAVVLRALKHNEKNGELIGELGKIQLALGEPMKAVETLSRAEALTGPQWHLSGALAVAYDRIQMFDQAERAYDKALELSPENADIMNNLALSLALKGELDRAIEMLEHASSLPEATSQMRQNLALLYSVRGDLQAAERLVRRDLPRQIADENMIQYRRIAESAAARSSGRGEPVNAVAQALSTPVQVMPASPQEPPRELPASPLTTVDAAPIVAPAEDKAEADAATLKMATSQAKPEASNQPDVAKANAAAPAEAAKSSAAADSMTAKSDEGAVAMAKADKPVPAASSTGSMTDKAASAETVAAAADSDRSTSNRSTSDRSMKGGLKDRMSGARSSDEEIERISLAGAKPKAMTETKAKPEPAAMSRPRSLTGSMADKADAKDAARPGAARATETPPAVMDKTMAAEGKEKAETGKPEMAKPAAPVSALAEPAPAEPALAEPALAKPETAKPETAKAMAADTGDSAQPSMSATKAMPSGNAKVDKDIADKDIADKDIADKAMAEMAKSGTDGAGPAAREPAKVVTAEADPAPVGGDAAETETPQAGTVEPAEAPMQLASSNAGGYRLQLGSFRSVDRANRLIRTLADDHGDLLQSTQLGVREASIDGKQQVFRVISDTLPDRSAASTLCDALKGRDVGCLMLRGQ